MYSSCIITTWRAPLILQPPTQMSREEQQQECVADADDGTSGACLCVSTQAGRAHNNHSWVAASQPRHTHRVYTWDSFVGVRVCGAITVAAALFCCMEPCRQERYRPRMQRNHRGVQVGYCAPPRHPSRKGCCCWPPCQGKLRAGG